MNSCYDQPVSGGLTIDRFARLAGTTVRQVRALQTQGILPRPVLVGRTGFYDTGQLDRLRAILRLQRQGFSLAGIAALLQALDTGMTLEDVVGLRRRTGGEVEATEADEEFAGWPDSPKGQLLSVIPTNLQGLSVAS
jgi:DNA-binding transcriptional MerR regulator